MINNFGTEVPISATDRAKIGATLVADYCDNHFSYSKQSPLYRLTKNSLEGTSIEEIQTHLLRDLKSKYSKSELAELEKILEDLPERFKPYGLLLDEIKTLFVSEKILLMAALFLFILMVFLCDYKEKEQNV